MRIDLNKDGAWTLETARDLIGSKDDSDHRQLRVDDQGILYLSDDVGNRNLSGVLFRLETWSAGTGYCGTSAAADDEWVGKVHRTIAKHWAARTRGYVDFLEN